MHTLPERKQNKRIFHTIAALGLIVSLLLLTVSGCAPKGSQRFRAEWTGSFDTLIQLIAYTDDEKTFNQFERQAEERFRELHQLYDRYNSYEGINNIRTINEQAGGEPVKVEQEIIDLLIIFRDYSLATGRVVDVTLGPLLEIWHDYRTRALADPTQAEVPPLNVLQQAATLRGLEDIEIDTDQQTVRLARAGMSLDVGSVAKGYATELVARELEAAGLTSALISAGGSNVRMIGKPSDSERPTWNIGLQDPDSNALVPQTSEVLDTVMVNDTSIVTSGDYQRYYMVDGELYHHLIDPVTLMPGNYFRAVSVMLKDSGLADFLSSTLFLLPLDQGVKMLAQYPGAEALWILPDGTVKATEGMRAVLKDKIAGPIGD